MGRRYGERHPENSSRSATAGRSSRCATHGLAAALRPDARAPGRLEGAGTAGRASGSGAYDWDRIAAATESVYAAALASPEPCVWKAHANGCATASELINPSRFSSWGGRCRFGVVLCRRAGHLGALASSRAFGETRPVADPAKPPASGWPYDSKARPSLRRSGTTRGSSRIRPATSKRPRRRSSSAARRGCGPPAPASAPAARRPNPRRRIHPRARSRAPVRHRLSGSDLRGHRCRRRRTGQARCESKTGSKAYVVCRPYYKVRVGDCASSDGCRDLQAQLRDAGYDTVWIVPDAIAP